MVGVSTAMPKTYKSWANGYKTVVDTMFKKGKDYTSGIFYKDTTESWEDRIVEVGGIDDFSVWEDGEGPAQSNIVEGYSKNFTQVPFGLKVPFGRLFQKFVPKDVVSTKKAMIQLGKKAYRQMQKAPFSLLSYGFSDTNAYLTGITGTTVSALGPDSKRLFSTLHSCSPVNATTWSNVLSDNAVVGVDALESMIENLHNQLDDKSEKKHYGEEGYIWVVPIEKLADAKKAVLSDKDPDSAENAINPFHGNFDGRPIEVRYVPWISDVSSTAHFLIAREVVEEEMPLVMLTSQEFYTDDYTDDDSKTAYARGQMIYVTGFVSGRGLVGSLGTGTGTYSD